MPVKNNRGRKHKRAFGSKKLSRSLSLPRNRDLKITKNNSAIKIESNNDIELDQCNDDEQFYPSFLKKLQSDFNKKYISDKVTIDSKLRWNRNLQQSPGDVDQNTPTNMFLEKVKTSPQIPSPSYSPIRAVKKNSQKMDHQLNSLSISFETASSDESITSKLFKTKKKTLVTSNSTLPYSQRITESKILNHKKRTKQFECSKSSPTLLEAENLDSETLNTKVQTRKSSKKMFEIKTMKKLNVKHTGKNLQYYINEEHFNMENILETESEKSDFPMVRTPMSMSLGMVSTPSPDNSIKDELQLETSYFIPEQSPPQTKFKNEFEILYNLNTFENESNIDTSKNYTEIETHNKKINSLTFSRERLFQQQFECVENSNSNLSNQQNFESITMNINDKSTSTNIASIALEHKVEDKQKYSNLSEKECISNTTEETIFKENINRNELDNQSLIINNDTDLQGNIKLVKNNEAFQFPILHNRVSSLISPLSIDSAKGSSIDIETNYHPKHCEIFWGRKGNFPFWPCLIWPDPEGKTVRIEKQSHRQYISYHVKFFADNGQRSWIYKDNLIAYNGREDFERRTKEQSLKMKASLFKKYFVVSRAKVPIWEQAVKEADRILAVHIEKRTEKFNEILKESIELLRMHKQQRRSSISINRSLLHNSINDFNEDLLNTSGFSSSLSLVSKRRRSSSLYENIAKRHKIESDTEEVSQHEILTTINTNSNKFLFPKELVEVMADYTLRTTENEEFFHRFENCFIQLFHIVRDSIHQEYENASTSTKRHPNRILRKNLVARLQKHYNDILSKPSVNTEKVKRKRTTLDVPSIQIVLKDIIDLIGDKQYLFRHLKKGTVCKICSKPDDLLKCSGYCESWIHKNCADLTHKEYLEKSKLGKRKKRGKKPTENIDLHQGKEDVESNFSHITGDDENSLNKSKAEEVYVDDQMETINPSEKISCKECLTHVKPFCLICKSLEEEIDSVKTENSMSSNCQELSSEIILPSQSKSTLLKCKIPSCNKYYHLHCLKMWPQAYVTKTKDVINKVNFHTEKLELLCPSHTCHTCTSDDPQHHIQLGKNNIIKCMLCPATYHFSSKCVPAGTKFLTANTIICPRHNEETKPTNTDWCFLCSGSGNLICCDSCPSSFHLSCLKLNQAPKEKYLCELCQNGCLPLYGDLVWCKFGQYKWWPSVIIPPPIIPQNLHKKSHTQFGFCVRFLGTNDYGWTGRHRVYLYQEDDYSSDQRKDKSLQKAIEEAKIAWDYFEINKPKKDNIKDDIMPLPYKTIKNNLPTPPVKIEYDISEINPCECSPNSDSPCGYNSQCLNRMVMIECDPKICPAKFNCENQMFEKRQYAPLTVRKTIGKGFGLVCTTPIAGGSFIIEYIGELIDDNELKRRIEEKQKEKEPHYYFFSIESNLTIDAGPKGNLARFMNHSCEPNCEPQMWTVNGVKRIGLFAKCDIEENTELTFHYNFDSVGDNKVVCHCGARNCKGFIGGIYNKKSNDSKYSTQKNNENVFENSVDVKVKKFQKIIKKNDLK